MLKIRKYNNIEVVTKAYLKHSHLAMPKERLKRELKCFFSRYLQWSPGVWTMKCSRQTLSYSYIIDTIGQSRLQNYTYGTPHSIVMTGNSSVASATITSDNRTGVGGPEICKI